jgi:transcriptional regulator with XRE-family HTH domain
MWAKREPDMAAGHFESEMEMPEKPDAKKRDGPFEDPLLDRSLGAILKELRIRRDCTPTRAASILGISKQYLSRIEQGRDLPAIDFLLRFYSYFIDFEHAASSRWLAVLLYRWVDEKGKRQHELHVNREGRDTGGLRGRKEADGQPSTETRGEDARRKLREIVELVLLHDEALSQSPMVAPSPRVKSLADFPDAFLPLTIVCGDRRLTRPFTRGDVFVKSAAISDLMFLPKLKLPEDCVVRPDKMLAAMEERQVREILGSANVLVIGSPIVNLFAREFNRHCLFRFITDPALPIIEAKLRTSSLTDIDRIRAFWRIAEDPLRQPLRQSETDLPADVIQKLQEEVREVFGAIIPSRFIDNMLDQGLSDPISHAMKLRRKNYNDFALVSLGVNPYDDTGQRMCILAAGLGELGTAHAVRTLGENVFANHPWGGIFEVQRDTFKSYPKDFEEAVAHWQTPDYSPALVIERLQTAMKSSATNSSLSALTEKEIMECLEFAVRLITQPS